MANLRRCASNAWRGASLLILYLVFGALHELAHVAAACLKDEYDWTGSDWYGILLGRRTSFPQEPSTYVRHVGWAFSLLTALLLRWCCGPSSVLTFVSSVTALEALWSDLLRLPVLSIFPFETVSSQFHLFCGNFGIILLNDAWFNGSTALNVLETMIRVTMLRGAQAGGVVTFPQNRRSRVVNRKRTDLARRLRSQIVRDNAGHSSPRVYCGHTRFATSSQADYAGTHPQQWTPPKTHAWRFLDRTTFRFAPRRDVGNYVTHNGDFDFYKGGDGGCYSPLATVQQWLESVTHVVMPAAVDSCAVAGMVDILRTAGSFSLSARYAVALGLSTSCIQQDDSFPETKFFDEVGRVFEDALIEMLQSHSFEKIEETQPSLRKSLARAASTRLHDRHLKGLSKYVSDDESQCTTFAFCVTTVDAFFDNDLLWTTQTFLRNAKGSFGLCFASSLDTDRQLCLAARGQTMSVAFYPTTGIICYGSEQSAVKAGMGVVPQKLQSVPPSSAEVDDDILRLDLDDLGGEVLCLDWSGLDRPVSTVNSHLVHHELMNGTCRAILYQESKATVPCSQIYNRMTRLSRNPFIKPLRKEAKDPILEDIRDIPKVMKAIQDDWDSTKASVSMNRLAAYNLSRCLRARLEGRIKGTARENSVDLLLTGCEVSLWVAEQFAADLQKSFPNLRIVTASSNKLLGLYGQELSIPALGFSYSPKTHDLHDAIVVIVSHSGGTFAPLACSNLLQSTTKNLFVVTSEWDTQIAKQLRAIDNLDDSDNFFNCRTFSTDVGVRHAEPCSVSVVATHQLLTNLFEYISVLLLNDPRYRAVSGAVITEQDIHVLETCNRFNIAAVCRIVGRDAYGNSFENRTEKELRSIGDLWSEHILENTRAYIMSFVYVFATVISGFPIASSIARIAGWEGNLKYLVHAIDAAIYFWLPQINITLLRLIQQRNFRHRMVGRTVVVGDIPWVAQCAEAFLSKIFACSYSIAGLNVLSANPADHFVHRHTHRVVRGTLLVCGRPDGRLSALSTAEASVCLSVNQASSIQSWGGRCESVTIGHNPFELPLSHKGIFLERKRPMFVCERMLIETDAKLPPKEEAGPRRVDRVMNSFRKRVELSMSRHRDMDCSIRPHVFLRRSAAALLGAYINFVEEPSNTADDDFSVASVVDTAIQELKWSDKARKLFEAFDQDEDGFLTESEFVEGTQRLGLKLPRNEVIDLFKLAQAGDKIDYDEFLKLTKMSRLDHAIKLPPSHRDERGHIQIAPSNEKYFGQTLRKLNAGKSGNDMDFMVARSQQFAMQLYETRIASLQRFISMTVLFHQMGMRVQTFFERYSLGMLGYRMDRTHSIMRIATTASPVSGADVKQQMRRLHTLRKVRHSIHVISMAYLRYKERVHFEDLEQSYRTKGARSAKSLSSLFKSSSNRSQRSATQSSTRSASSHSIEDRVIEALDPGCRMIDSLTGFDQPATTNTTSGEDYDASTFDRWASYL